MESDLLTLIERLEALVNDGGRVPLSARVMIPDADAFHLIDQMRQSLPREIVRARHIYQERDRILAEARLEADSMRTSAQAERDTLLAEHSITVDAIRNAENMMRETRTECERIRLEADAYALNSLRDMQVHLLQIRREIDQTLKTVANGVELLETRARFTNVAKA
jgi:hypothetical protein